MYFWGTLVFESCTVTNHIFLFFFLFLPVLCCLHDSYVSPNHLHQPLHLQQPHQHQQNDGGLSFVSTFYSRFYQLYIPQQICNNPNSF